MKNGTTTIEDISSLLPAEYNPRRISDDAMAGLKASLKRFGQVQEIVRNTRTKHIVGGHQRVQALKDLGFKEVRVFNVELSETEEKALNVALNSPAISGEFTADLNKLLDEIRTEMPEDYEAMLLEQLRMDIEQVPNEGLCDEDEVPEAPEEPTTKLGDIYQLGSHRLMCGDSTNIQHVETLMNGEKADMVFTDPPYGMNYSGRGTNTSNTILNDNIDPTEFYNLLPEIGERYIWGRIENYKHLLTEPRDTIVWVKNNFGMGNGYRGQYECCFYFGSFKGSDSDVWECKKDLNYVHPTQKPVELCERAIRNSNPKNVIDIFGGSGSTLIACEKTNRRCFMMELDPKYVDVIIARWEKFTGKKAELVNG